MKKGRLEAFSDGVIAIIITIMVLELKAPAVTDWGALGPLLPVFLSYVLSFLYVGIYWNNHHHLIHACRRVTPGVMWANLHLLFWLSLLPFATAWAGEHRFAQAPSVFYGVVLLLAAVAYVHLQSLILRQHARDSAIANAFRGDFKGIVSPVLYVCGIALSFVYPPLGPLIYALVALLWLVPDKRISKSLEADTEA